MSPATQQNRTREHQLGIRLTAAELAEVREQAERRGMSITRLILEAVRYVARLPFDGGFKAR
jgi:hypothetical protein